MGVNMPQWLISSFVRSVKNIGAQASVNEIESIAIRLVQKLQDASHEYHNLNHIAFMLNKLDELADSAHDSDCLRIATWYHAVFYNSYLGGVCPSLSNENPIELIKSDLSAVGVDKEICDHIANILNGAGKYSVNSNDEIDTQILFDCSIAIFSGTPQEYKNYLKSARQEYSDVSLFFILSTRKHFINKMLSRPKLFLSPLGQIWEIPARQNLEAELVRITTELSKIPEEERIDLENLSVENDFPSCQVLKDTVLIKRVSVATKLSKAKNTTSSVSIQSTGNLGVLSTSQSSHNITKIDDLTSSLEMVEDCLESKEICIDSPVKNIEFE